MCKTEKLSYNDLLNRIYEASKKDKLVFFIGAGVSMEMGFPNWNTYLIELYSFWRNRFLEQTGSKELPNDLNELLREMDEESERIKNNKINFDKRLLIDDIYIFISRFFGEEYLLTHKIDFEKKLFHLSQDKIKTDNVLFELCKFDATYITTNYDDSIEQYLEKVKGVSVNYNDIYEFNENNVKFTINTVVHMHGGIKGSSNNLVNSKELYDFIYRENSSVMKKLRNILNDPELLVIFIGSSIEQDILRLMTNDEFDHIDKISLLTYKSSNNESFDGKVVPYFYAHKHEDLRPFLHSLIGEIYSLSGINNTENYYKFREDSTSKEEIDGIFNQYDNPSSLFYGLDPEIEKKRIFQLTELSKFFDGKIFVNQELWKLIIKYSYEFNDTQKNNIINHISNSTSSSCSYHAYICFIKMNPNEEQKDFLFEQLSKKDNINWSPFYINDDLMASWFLFNKIESSNYYYEYSDFIEENRNYKIDSKLENKILREMCIDKKLQKSFYFESFCTSRWGIIYKLLLEERIFLNNNLWIHDICKNHRNLQFIKGILKFYDARRPFYTSEVNTYEIELSSVTDNDLNDCENIQKIFNIGRIYDDEKVLYFSIEKNIETISKYLDNKNNSNIILLKFFIENISKLFVNYKCIYYKLLTKVSMSNDFKRDLYCSIANYYRDNPQTIIYDQIDDLIWKELTENYDKNKLLSVFLGLNIDFSLYNPSCKFKEFLCSTLNIYLSRLIESFSFSEYELLDYINNLDIYIKDIAIGYYCPNADVGLKKSHYYLLGLLNSNKNISNDKISKLIDVSKLDEFENDDIEWIITHLLKNINPLIESQVRLENPVKYIDLIMNESKSYDFKGQWIEFLVKKYPNCTSYFIDSIFSTNMNRYNNFKKYYKSILKDLNIKEWSVSMVYLNKKFDKLLQSDKEIVCNIYFQFLKMKALTKDSSYSFDYVIRNSLLDKKDLIHAAGPYLDERTLQKYKSVYVDQLRKQN